jgi:Rrf2 family protein
MLHLVADDAPARSARDLADYQGLSPSFVAKLFTRLERAGLVRSTEGIRGGFRLARPAEEISVLDVADAIEGSKPIFDCKEIRRDCVLYGDAPPAAATRGVCGIHAVMIEADMEMRSALARHSLGDIAARVAAKIPARQREASRDWFAARVSARAARS